MEEFTRLFFTGEALQRVFVCVCNGSTMDIQYKISKVISSMLKTSLCIRLTPIGIAPFRNDITMIIPYSVMDKVQLEFLDDLASRASFVPVSSTQYRDPIRAIGMGNEVMVITMIESMKIWSDGSREGVPLCHRHVSCPLGKSSSDKERMSRAKEEASRAVRGCPMAGDAYWQLDTLDVLKAFVACVFRSKQFTGSEMKRGICDIIIQMVIHDVGLTQNIINSLGDFINGVQSVHDISMNK